MTPAAGRRLCTAICNAKTTRSVVMRSAIDQPTTGRGKASMTTAGESQPSAVQC